MLILNVYFELHKLQYIDLCTVMFDIYDTSLLLNKPVELHVS